MLIVLQKLFRKNKHVILILAQNSKSKKSKFNKDTNFHGINLHRLTHFNFLLTRRIYSLPVPQRKLLVFIKASKFMLFGLIVRECILCVLNIHAIVLSLLLRKALFFAHALRPFFTNEGRENENEYSRKEEKRRRGKRFTSHKPLNTTEQMYSFHWIQYFCIRAYILTRDWSHK